VKNNRHRFFRLGSSRRVLISQELKMSKPNGVATLTLTYWICVLGGLFLLAACSSAPAQTPSPTQAKVPPSATPPVEAGEPYGLAVDDFLSAQVGAAYFTDHFVRSQAAQVGSWIKASYLYNYAPYVADFPMTVLYDPALKALSPEEVSLILLSPQEFVLDKQAAIAAAVSQGVDAAGPHQVELRLGPETQQRFAWKVTAPASPKLGAPPGALAVVTLDVETGKVYQINIAGISDSH
jgi:hypothetical protein